METRFHELPYWLNQKQARVAEPETELWLAYEAGRITAQAKAEREQADYERRVLLISVGMIIFMGLLFTRLSDWGILR